MLKFASFFSDLISEGNLRRHPDWMVKPLIASAVQISFDPADFTPPSSSQRLPPKKEVTPRGKTVPLFLAVLPKRLTALKVLFALCAHVQFHM